MKKHDPRILGVELFDRRELLRRCCGAALSGLGLAAMSRLELLASAAAANYTTPGYRALVCVFLDGGNDAFNMFLPRSGSEYTQYATARQNLAVPAASVIPVSPTNSVPGAWGFHPSCPELAALFESNRLGVVANVGTLVEPVTRADYLAQPRVVQLPSQLFSHNDQATQWQTSLPGDTSVRTGWCGRMADEFLTSGLTQQIAMNTSLSGTNTLQTGLSTLAYNVSSNGVVRFRGLDPNDPNHAGRRAAFLALRDNPPNHPLAQEFAAIQTRAMDTAETLAAALDAAPDLNTVFPTGSSVAAQLSMVARLIQVRATLGMQRQVFLVRMGGWDTHGQQFTRHPQLLAQLSQALDAFQDALVELGEDGNVVTFTSSEFGRTLTSNGDGTDHGWGSHALVMGTPVLGRQVFGQLPELVIDGPDDTRSGRLIPTTSTEEYASRLAAWLGVAAGTEMTSVFPNLGAFSTTRTDLTFLGP